MPEISHTLTSILKDCHNWMSSDTLQLNINKTKCMLIHQLKRQTHPLNVMNNLLIDQVKPFKLLGCDINHHLSWDDHIQHITVKVTRNINLLRRMSCSLPRRYSSCSITATYSLPLTIVTPFGLLVGLTLKHRS